MNNLSNVHKRELKSEDLNQALSEIQLVFIHSAAGMLVASVLTRTPWLPTLSEKVLGSGLCQEKH